MRELAFGLGYPWTVGLSVSAGPRSARSSRRLLSRMYIQAVTSVNDRANAPYGITNAYLWKKEMAEVSRNMAGRVAASDNAATAAPIEIAKRRRTSRHGRMVITSGSTTSSH